MNDFTRQILKFWNELGINQKVSLVVASAFVLAGMAALVFWSGQPQLVMLYGGLDGKDMSDVVRALDEQGIKYEIRNGTSIYVAKESVYQVRMDLASKGVPGGGGIGFEIFDRTSFGISDFVQRTNYVRAVQGELQRTIAQLKGVRGARVMIVVPQNRLLVTGEAVRSTASVMVDTGGQVLQTEAVNSIRFLVANSVEGLLPNDVVVVDANGRPLSQDLAEDGVIGAATGQFKFRKSLEDYFTGKVETMLARVVGPQNVVARVSVELDTEAQTFREEKFDPESQVIRTQTSNDQVSKGVEARRNNAVGTAGNTPDMESNTSSDLQSSNEESRKNRTITYEINRETREVVKAPGSVRGITAAVFITKRYVERDGQKVEEPRSQQELERLRQMVVNALGVDLANNSTGGTAAVTLIETDFAPTEDLATIHEPGLPGQVLEWAEVLRNFVAVGVAAIMFLIFLRMLKRHKPEPISLEVIDEAGTSKKNTELQPRLTPELLNELIREKPENVSTALRNWALEAGKK